MALRDVLLRMLSSRKWEAYAEPVSPDEDPQYWETVGGPGPCVRAGSISGAAGLGSKWLLPWRRAEAGVCSLQPEAEHARAGSARGACGLSAA